MKSGDETMNKKRGKLWKIGALVLLSLCGLVVMQWLSGRMSLRSVLAVYEREGESLDWRKVVKPVPENANNGKEDLLAAISRLPRMYGDWLAWQHAAPAAAIPHSRYRVPVEIVEYPEDGTRRERWVTNVWSELGPRIEDFGTNWTHARRAATNDVIDLGLDWSRGSELELPHFAPVSYLHAWTRAAVMNDLHKGDRETAWKRLTAGWRILKIYDEPVLISALMRISGAWFLSQATWETLSHGGWTEEQLVTLQTAIDEVRFVESMDRAICQTRCGEFALWHRSREDPSLLRKYAPMESPAMNRFLLDHPWIWRTFYAGDEMAWVLRDYQDGLGELRQGWKTRSLSAYFVAWPEDHPTPEHFVFSHWPGVAFRMTGFKVFRSELQREFLGTSIAIERYKLRHNGRSPEALADLVPGLLPDLPVDWMDGKTLRYRKSGAGNHVLWSVGDDGVDDGGVPVREFYASSHPVPSDGDWVWPRVATELEIQAYLKELRAELKKSAP
ncbi:MAG: hypothetical protein ACI9OD_003095 [Limisphaerales bacterium]|jgi:hypothetical protein